MKKKIFTKKEIKKITGASRSGKIGVPFYYASSYYAPPLSDEIKRIANRKDLSRLPYRCAQGMQKYFSLSDENLAKVLGVPKKSLAEMKKTGRLNVRARIALIKITWVTVIAEKVFENEKSAVEWLSRPQSGLGDKIPIDLLKTEKGMKEVINLLIRIEQDVIV